MAVEAIQKIFGPSHKWAASGQFRPNRHSEKACAAHPSVSTSVRVPTIRPEVRAAFPGTLFVDDNVLLSFTPGPLPGSVYTFYLYKGGVGRSMALVNVGVLLADHSWR